MGIDKMDYDLELCRANGIYVIPNRCESFLATFYYDGNANVERIGGSALKAMLWDKRYGAVVMFRMAQYLLWKMEGHRYDRLLRQIACADRGGKPNILFRLKTWVLVRYYMYLSKFIDRLNFIMNFFEISPLADIDRGVCGGGRNLAVTAYSKIGRNVIIDGNVTIAPGPKGAPVIGDNVEVGTSATIVGNVTIGDNAKIGANSLVINDVPSGTTVLGVPARPVFRQQRPAEKLES